MLMRGCGVGVAEVERDAAVGVGRGVTEVERGAAEEVERVAETGRGVTEAERERDGAERVAGASAGRACLPTRTVLAPPDAAFTLVLWFPDRNQLTPQPIPLVRKPISSIICHSSKYRAVRF
ncbi:MAG: hypothetical protein LBC23_00695 [Coriobacteriales bacterium]|nr:hypothetical protein [Coriobacteriales bacterium]